MAGSRNSQLPVASEVMVLRGQTHPDTIPNQYNSQWQTKYLLLHQQIRCSSQFLSKKLLLVTDRDHYRKPQGSKCREQLNMECPAPWV